jgi:hypothetical protein
MLKLEHVVLRAGGIEQAVDLLYQFNYIGPPYDDAAQDILRGFMTQTNDYSQIKHPTCILMDPYLLSTLFHCYHRGSGHWEMWTKDLDAVLERESSVGDDYLAKFVAFRVENTLVGLKALRLWQCQSYIVSDDRSSWANQVELAYNLARFSIADEPSKGLLDYRSFEYALHRALGFSISEVELIVWWELLCGFYCAHIPPRCDNESGYGRTLIRRVPLAKLGLREILSRYHLLEPPIRVQLSLEDVHEFNATFILSGPFNFQLTSNITQHLEFSPRDPNKILLYYDGEPFPAISRGGIYGHNRLSNEFDLMYQ